ncbi:MAG: hypothetical protein ACK4UN_22070, partial [Limisphaerales bacterium]
CLREEGYRFYRITHKGLIPAQKLERFVRPPFEFLNCLLTRRGENEIGHLSRQLREALAGLNLFETTKYQPLSTGSISCATQTNPKFLS